MQYNGIMHGRYYIPRRLQRTYHERFINNAILHNK